MVLHFRYHHVLIAEGSFSGFIGMDKIDTKMLSILIRVKAWTRWL